MPLAEAFAAVVATAVIAAVFFALADRRRRSEPFRPTPLPSCSSRWLYGRRGCGPGGLGVAPPRPTIDPPPAADLCCGYDWGPFGLDFIKVCKE